MPSNQLPEDVREKCLIAMSDAAYPYSVAGNEERFAAVAPIIIEWARRDQAETDARIAKGGGTFWDAGLGQYRSLYPAEIETAIRAQFTPETTGGKTK